MQDIFSILERRRAIAPNADSLDDELKHYLDAPPIQNVLNPVLWWKDRQEIYPNLSRMAIDYLTILGTCSVRPRYGVYADPRLAAVATAVDVERIWSKGHLAVSHTRSRLSAQTIRTLLCLGAWSMLGFVKPNDSAKATALKDLEGDQSDYEMEDGWDDINLSDLDD